MNFWKISYLPVFSGIFLYFLGQRVPVNSSKRLFPVQLTDGKLRKFQRFSRVCLHLGRFIRVFFSAHRPALFAHSYRVRDSFDLSTVPRPADCQCSLD